MTPPTQRSTLAARAAPTRSADSAPPASRGRLKLPVIRSKSLNVGSLAIFYRSLATMFAAGVRIDRALRLLAEQTDDLFMAEISNGLCQSVSAGAPLSLAMAAWPDVFHPMEQRLVQVGETSGHLDHILDRLSTYEEKRRTIGMRVSGALTYPILLFVLAMIALVFVPPYLFGGLFQLIETSGVPIPLLTRCMLVGSKAVSSPIFLAAMAVVCVVVGRLIPGMVRNPTLRLQFYELALRLPVLGNALRIITVTRFARALEVLLGVGVSLDQSMEMAFAAADNPVLAKRLGRTVVALRAGATMSESLEDTGFFPRAFILVVAVGEEAGKVPTLVSRLADIYEVELEYALESAIAALEPMMLLFMGIVVGVVIIATMLPMMTVIQHL